MKEENKREKPWYVKASDYFNENTELIKRILLIAMAIVYIIVPVIYTIYNCSHMKSYEEDYDAFPVNVVIEVVVFGIIFELKVLCVLIVILLAMFLIEACARRWNEKYELS